MALSPCGTWTDSSTQFEIATRRNNVGLIKLILRQNPRINPRTFGDVLHNALGSSYDDDELLIKTLEYFVNEHQVDINEPSHTYRYKV